jgi:hypothetical protein
MGQLQGLKDYLHTSYDHSVFTQALDSHQTWTLHVHGHRIVQASIVENLTYDLKVDVVGEGRQELPKIQVKFLYPTDVAAAVTPLVKTDKKIQALGLQPILPPGERYFVKNKTLFPLMQDKQVVFFTLLEGEVIRGIIADFSRYEITVHLKGGIPVVLLRHSIYDTRTKNGRCLLKSFQDQHKDWQKSPLFVS